MTMLRKALTAGAVVLVLASMPSPLAAQPKPTTSHAAPLSVKEALASWVHDLFKIMAQSIIPLPPTPPTTDGRCTIDPNGGCAP
jgi:hypothetical protein